MTLSIYRRFYLIPLLYFSLLLLFGTSSALSHWKLSDYPAHVTVHPNEFLLECHPTISSQKCSRELTLFGKKRGVDFRIKHTYDVVLNGLSIAVDDRQTMRILADSNVIRKFWHNSLLLNSTVPFASTKGQLRKRSTKIDFSSMDSLGYRELHNKGITGKGIRVGIFDTFIVRSHTSFQDRIISNEDFVHDSTPNRHGTNVAEFLGGKNAQFAGVAPEVQIGGYAIIGSNGYGYQDIMVAALEKAMQDKMDIINMSLEFNGCDDEVFLTALQKVISKNVIVVAAESNAGKSGIFQTGCPALIRNVIAVGAATMAKNGMSNEKALIQTTPVDTTFILGGKSKEILFKYFILAHSTNDDPSECCKALPAGRFNNKIAMIQIGGCPMAEKIQHVATAGAKGAILIKGRSPIDPKELQKNLPIPVVIIPMEAGMRVKKTMPTEDSIEKMYPESTSLGYVSDFSAWGPSLDKKDILIKPQIVAPGFMVFGKNKEDLSIMGGTSMAAPYISGLAALYLQYHRKHNTGLANLESFEKSLMNNAKPVFEENREPEGLSNIMRQGAGLVSPTSTVFSEVSIFPPSMNFMVEKFKQMKIWKMPLKVINHGVDPRKFTLSHSPSLAVSLSNLANPSQRELSCKVEFRENTFTLNPKATKNIEVVITPPTFNPAEVKESLFVGGYIQITLDNSKHFNLSVPYSGFVGKVQNLQVFNPKDMPYLEHSLTKKKVFNKDEMIQLSIKEREYISVYFRTQMPVPKISILLVKVENPEKVVATLEEYTSITAVREEIRETNFYYFQGFDKKYQIYPNGNYRIILKCYKPELDGDSKGATEAWVSPIIQINRKSTDIENNNTGI